MGEFISFGEIKPRVGRNVILRFWGKLYLARFNGHMWELPLSKTTVRAEDTDEWIGVQ